MGAAIQALRVEHQLILRALDAAEEAAHRLENGAAVSPQTLVALLQFFSFLSHRTHRDKEDDLLFPALRDKGFPDSQGCIGILLAEHEEAADAFRQMVSEAEAYNRGEQGSGQRWAQAARLYVEAMRRHIRHEEDVLFHKAGQALNEAEQQELARQFERLDQRARRAGLDEIIENFESAARSLDK